MKFHKIIIIILACLLLLSTEELNIFKHVNPYSITTISTNNHFQVFSLIESVLLKNTNYDLKESLENMDNSKNINYNLYILPNKKY